MEVIQPHLLITQMSKPRPSEAKGTYPRSDRRQLVPESDKVQTLEELLYVSEPPFYHL